MRWIKVVRMNYLTGLWRWGVDDAKERQFEMHVEPAWDAEDIPDMFNDRTHYPRDLAWYGMTAAADLRWALNGEHEVLCYCGCGEMFPEHGGLYDTWDFDHGRDHLSWLLNQ